MGLFDWLWNMLQYLGLYHKTGKILFLGLDDAGKTTLLQRLKEGSLGTHKPTIHPNIEELDMGSITLKTYDLGGHFEARRLWKEYFVNVDAIVFLVDAANPDRFEESRKELDLLLQQDDLKHCAFAILGNKIDIPSAATPDQLKTAFGLHGLITGPTKPRPGVRPVDLFMCSVVRQSGYGEAFRWLATYLRDK